MLAQVAAPPGGVQRPLRAGADAAQRPTVSRWSSLLPGLIVLIVSGLSTADVQLPLANPEQPIVIAADAAHRWQQDDDEVWLLRGSCTIEQGPTTVRAADAVLWIRRGELSQQHPIELTAYLEGEVSVSVRSRAADDTPVAKMQSGHWLGKLQSVAGVQVRATRQHQVAPAHKPPLLERAERARGGSLPKTDVQRAQFSQPVPAAPPPATASAGLRVQVYPRSSVGWRTSSFLNPQQTERITITDSGVRILIDGYADGGVVDISTDRLVAWSANTSMDFSAGSSQTGNQPIELYLEGNVVFRQGDQVVYAERMYYNVQGDYGVILQAEIVARPPNYQGFVRLKADVLQQIDRTRYQALDAAVTTSRLGVPQYWLQSESVYFEDQRRPVINPFTGQLELDPVTGEPLTEGPQRASAGNNFVFLGGWPVFYWPRFSADLTQPTYYLEGLSINNDRVFGTQVLTTWNAFQLLGITDPPEGTRWTGSADYLSARGLGFGSNVTFERDDFWGHPGPSAGFLDGWFINDHGLDDLGQDRRAIPPAVEFRGRAYGRHRYESATGYQVTSEVGWISDGNFLEEYFEQEWDQEKNQTTDLDLKRYVGNATWGVLGKVRVNDFFTQTEWLPRLDHFQIGHSLLGDRLTWFEHTNVGYGRVRKLDLPAPQSLFTFLPWDVNVEGVRAATRQEIDLPFQAGVVKVVPYLLGEAAHWGEDLNAEPVTRLYGQAGVRASLPLWRLDPTVQDPLFNLNGLAHKIVLEADLFVADSDQDLSIFPLYDALDDDSVEFLRRTLGTVPTRFDSRDYALRTGMQSWVAAPSTEIADDLLALRLGARHRWQTKRGLPGHQRVIDWLTLDVEGLFYPEADRDNFGQEIGPVNYDARWHIGDRLTLLSDGYFDFFAQGLRTFSLGGAMSRPGRSQYVLNLRSIEGPIDATVVSSSVNYLLSPKWIVNYGSSIDFSETGNIGQVGNIVRVGESFLVSLGFNYDAGRDNFGVRFAIEPRFLTSRLGRVGGRPIPPVGAFGLE